MELFSIQRVQRQLLFSKECNMTKITPLISIMNYYRDTNADVLKTTIDDLLILIPRNQVSKPSRLNERLKNLGS